MGRRTFGPGTGGSLLPGAPTAGKPARVEAIGAAGNRPAVLARIAAEGCGGKFRGVPTSELTTFGASSTSVATSGSSWTSVMTSGSSLTSVTTSGSSKTKSSDSSSMLGEVPYGSWLLALTASASSAKRGEESPDPKLDVGSEANVTPCLSPVEPEAPVSPCLEVTPPEEPALSPCLKVVMPPKKGHKRIEGLELGPCLLVGPQSAELGSQGHPSKAHQDQGGAARADVLERLADSLPPDVLAKLRKREE